MADSSLEIRNTVSRASVKCGLPSRRLFVLVVLWIPVILLSLVPRHSVQAEPSEPGSGMITKGFPKPHPASTHNNHCEELGVDCLVVGTHLKVDIDEWFADTGLHQFIVAHPGTAEGGQHYAVVENREPSADGHTHLRLGCKINGTREYYDSGHGTRSEYGPNDTITIGLAMEVREACNDSNPPLWTGQPACVPEPTLRWRCSFGTSADGEITTFSRTTEDFALSRDFHFETAHHGLYVTHASSHDRVSARIFGHSYYHYSRSAHLNTPDNPPGVEPQVCYRCTAGRLRFWSDDTNNVRPWGSGAVTSSGDVKVWDIDGASTFRVCKGQVADTPCYVSTPTATNDYTSTPTPTPTPPVIPTITPTPNPDYSWNCDARNRDGPIHVRFIGDHSAGTVAMAIEHSSLAWDHRFIGSPQCFVVDGLLKKHDHQRASHYLYGEPDEYVDPRHHVRVKQLSTAVPHETPAPEAGMVLAASHSEVRPAPGAGCPNFNLWHVVTSFDPARDMIVAAMVAAGRTASWESAGLTIPSLQCDGSLAVSDDGKRATISHP